MRTIVIAALALLALSAGLGIGIGVSGAPYSKALLAVHKIVSVAFAVLCVIFYVGATRETGAATLDIVLAAVFAAALIALLATGAIMSGKQETVLPLKIAHAAASAVIALSAGWELIGYLLW